MNRWFILCATLLVSGCYGRRIDRCQVTCVDVCPDGLQCASDGYCHAPGDLEACTGEPDAADPDAAGTDAAQTDAAQTDAPTDAATSDATDADPADAPADGAVVLGDVAAVAAGAEHGCAIDASARLWCWGRNVDSEVGDGSTDRRVLTPRLIATGVAKVAPGETHSCAIAGGRLYCWGRNTDGQCGVSGAAVVPTPTEIIGGGTGWLDVAVGSRHTCALRQVAAQEVRAYCWGADAQGARGDGATPSSGATPTLVAGAVTTWSAITAAGDHTCAISNQQGYCWGENDLGQLGTGDQLDKDAPTLIAAGDNTQQRYAALTTGARTTCGQRAGRLYCWGDNGRFQYGDLAASALAPHEVTGAGTGWSTIALGPTTTCGVRNGAGLCWGDGSRGAIGDGGFVDRSTPTGVASLGAVTAMTVGTGHACTVDGARARCWGGNPNGQMGDGTIAAFYAPTRVGTATGWVDVAAAAAHTCARRDGAGRTELWCWGRNGARHVDPDAAVGAVLATPVEILSAGDWADVATGAGHTCAIARAGDDRHLWCWGDNGRGQVGNGGNTSIQPPAALTQPAVTTWSEVVAAAHGACALAGTTRYCWGANTGGELGTGTVADLPRPTMTSGTWQRVALGDAFGCALDAQGRPSCWGSDALGQRGLGAGDQSGPTPQQVTTLAAGALATGRAHACAAFGAGVMCWGANDAGQTGSAASPVPVDAPAMVPGTAGWTAVAAGGAHTCALDAGARLSCWGANQAGQLGVDQAATATPTAVGTATWTAIAAGPDHTCGISGGALYCWGDSAFGQVGVGATAHATPTLVLVP